MAARGVSPKDSCAAASCSQALDRSLLSLVPSCHTAPYCHCPAHCKTETRQNSVSPYPVPSQPINPELTQQLPYGEVLLPPSRWAPPAAASCWHLSPPLRHHSHLQLPLPQPGHRKRSLQLSSTRSVNAFCKLEPPARQARLAQLPHSNLLTHSSRRAHGIRGDPPKLPAASQKGAGPPDTNTAHGSGTQEAERRLREEVSGLGTSRH